MPPRIAPADWRPVGVPGLEPDADDAARNNRNTLVVAGPGAGKTELLAQRACYLLQTGLCPPPRRVLAISFKRDAARNLQDRVGRRCGPELARRFDSMTFDAFAKGLVDRFRAALPDHLRPDSDYRIDFGIEKGMRDLLDSLSRAESGLTDMQIRGIGEVDLYKGWFIGEPLPAVLANPPRSVEEAAARAVWHRLLKADRPARVNFHMLGRLAELVLASNPKVLAGLRATYAFVFLDEFQDATGVQYALTKTAFLGSSAVLTAVGDNKQRIMAWAGALDNVFGHFWRDFGAVVRRPKVNHRSAPELVRIQRYLISAIDPDSALPEAADAAAGIRGECRCLLYPDHRAESAHVAALIRGWMDADGLGPRDVCVITRNKPDEYTPLLAAELGRLGVRSRVEAELQDTLAEPLTSIVLDFLKLACRARDAAAWTATVEVLLRLDGDDGGPAAARRAQDRLATFLRRLRGAVTGLAPEPEDVRRCLGLICAFVGEPALRLAHQQYSQGDLWDKTLADCARHLCACRRGAADWSAAIDDLEGSNCVPIMTMHKSKGLEYDTVVFVGLEDSALWGFERSPGEEKNGFFVAFSRAKRRVVFTFCNQRARRAGGPSVAQERRRIAELYRMLQAAGVEPEVVEPRF